MSVTCKTGISVAYIHFTRAFDSVTHVKLLPVFTVMAFRVICNLLRWLIEFFTGRTHQTRVACFKFVRSCCIVEWSGARQWHRSCIVFNIYWCLAKLLESHGITAKLFADDVKVYFKICKLEGGYVFLQQALDLIATYGPVSGSSQYLLTNVTCLILDIAVK